MAGLALATVFTTTCAQAGFYAKASAFYVDPGNLSYSDGFSATMKSSAGFAVAAGYKLSMFRLEAEGQYYKNDIQGLAIEATEISTAGSKKNLNFFANAYIDVPFPFPLIKPYIGAGLGVAKVDINQLSELSSWQQANYEYADSESLFGYQLMLGLEISLFDTLTVYGGMRYQDFDSLSVTELTSMTKDRISSGTKRIWEIGLAIGF